MSVERLFNLLKKAFEIKQFNCAEYIDGELTVEDKVVLKVEIEQLRNTAGTKDELWNIDKSISKMIDNVNFLARNHDILSEAVKKGLIKTIH